MLKTASSLLQVLLCLLLASHVHGQSFSTSFTSTSATPTTNTPTQVDDTVNFATITAWRALPFCMKDQLQLYDGGIAAWIGCNDNYCLCSEKFAEAESMLASDTLQECSYVSHMAAATSILSEYCQQKGYTSLNGATSLNTGGIPTLPYPADATPHPTESPTDPSSSSSEDEGLDTQAIIGIVFGVLGFFVGIAAVYFAYKMWRVHQSNGLAASSPYGAQSEFSGRANPDSGSAGSFHTAAMIEVEPAQNGAETDSTQKSTFSTEV